jgi:hypothetical protein
VAPPSNRRRYVVRRRRSKTPGPPPTPMPTPAATWQGADKVLKAQVDKLSERIRKLETGAGKSVAKPKTRRRGGSRRRWVKSPTTR